MRKAATIGVDYIKAIGEIQDPFHNPFQDPFSDPFFRLIPRWK